MILRTRYRVPPWTKRDELIQGARRELEELFPAFVAHSLSEWKRYE